MRSLILGLLTIGLSATLLWHLSNIWRYGQYLVVEPNIAVLSVETAVLVLILGFAVCTWVSDLRAKGK